MSSREVENDAVTSELMISMILSDLSILWLFYLPCRVGRDEFHLILSRSRDITQRQVISLPYLVAGQHQVQQEILIF